MSNELYYCDSLQADCIPGLDCLEFRAKGQCEHRRLKEFGRYCGTHPATVREVTLSGEGLTICGSNCGYRVWIMDSWQSFCSQEDRVKLGCV